VIKELSAHRAQGPAAVFFNWSRYVLLVSGATSMLLASHAFRAGSLAASQPGPNLTVSLPEREESFDQLDVSARIFD
jgi:hypothetical protein